LGSLGIWGSSVILGSFGISGYFWMYTVTYKFTVHGEIVTNAYLLIFQVSK
jgi:hypothetical protein